MMKRFRFLVVLHLGLIILIFGCTASADTVKIGIINTQEVIQNSQAAQDVRDVFLRDLEAKRAVLRAKQEGVRAVEEELRSQGKGMLPAALKDKQENLAREIKELRRLRADLQEELKKKDVELTRKLIGEIKEVVIDYSKRKKYTVILEKNAVVYSADAIDITDPIIKAFDAKKGVAKPKKSLEKSTQKKK